MGNIISSPFKLESFTVVKFKIERKAKKQSKGDIEINPSGILDREGKNFSLLLDVSVKDRNNSFSLSLSGVGLFKFKAGIEDKELSNYFIINAPALIFPYVRAYISAVTALSGLSAVNLPVLNLTGLRETLKKNIIERTAISEIID